MNAIIQRISAKQDGMIVKVEIGIDAFGLFMSVNGVTLTSSDAAAADHFIVTATGVKLADMWNAARAADYVFEAGLAVAWEGNYHTKLFRNIEDANAHAIAVDAEETSEFMDGEVYIRAMVLS